MNKNVRVKVVLVVLGILVSIGWTPVPVRADDAELRQLRETVDAMAETIRQLQGRITGLEARPAALPEKTRAVSVPSAGSGAEIELLQSDIKSLKGSLSGLMRINGYYDFEYANDDKKDSSGEFKQHHLSLFFDKRIERYHLFSEVEFEYGPDIGATGGNATGSGEIKAETVWLEYMFNDQLNLRAGKLLLPQYWNVNHYPSTTLSTSRPKIVRNVFPADITGVSTYGSRYFDNDWGVSYTAFVGNGEAPDPAKDDVNEDKAIGGKLTAHIPLFDRFDVAASNYIGRDAAHERAYLWGAETQVNIDNFEFLAEVAHNSQADSFGFYLQPAYWFLPKWAGFYRLDSRDDNNKSDAANDAIRHTYGLRFQPIPAVSLKAEYYYDIPDRASLERTNGFLSSVAFFF
jgi:hypothetical protein